MTPTTDRCCASVYNPNGSWGNRSRQCTRRATVERDGKGYCKQHDPEAIKAKRDAVWADRQAQYAAARAERERTAACVNACAGIPDPATLRAQRDALLAAAKAARKHIEELREAWERGCLSEHDGKGGTRSNRNADVDRQLRTAIAAAEGGQ